MLYIKFTKDYFKELKKEEKFPKFINGIIYLWKIFRGGFFKNNVENGELIVLPRLNKKVQKNLIKYLTLFNVKTVCLSEELKKTVVMDEIQNLGIKVLDGKWLYKHLIKNIVEYIVLQKRGEMANQEISILVNKVSEIDIENIIILSEICKTVNIITPSESKLKRLEQYLYNEKGIILNITQNYARSLIKSDIIINMDLEQEEINKYAFPRKAILVSIENAARVLYKGFDGINVSSYKIIIPKKYVSEELNLHEFNKEILYESFIYKKTNPKNIIKTIENDGLKIENLVGINGEIQKNEYIRLQGNKRQNMII